MLPFNKLAFLPDWLSSHEWLSKGKNLAFEIPSYVPCVTHLESKWGTLSFLEAILPWNPFLSMSASAWQITFIIGVLYDLNGFHCSMRNSLNRYCTLAWQFPPTVQGWALGFDGQLKKQPTNNLCLSFPKEDETLGSK